MHSPDAEDLESQIPKASPSEVVDYYETKTEQIVRKYGPGPRIHFHTGIYDGTVVSSWSEDAIRKKLVLAQERLLEDSAEVWEAKSRLSGEILDVGCGLGGGAIFWAQTSASHVTGVTTTQGHIELAREYAHAAGVGDRVRIELCDAHTVPGESRFDAAVAIESSCYFDRATWFAALARLLRPGGRIHIIDCFVGDLAVAASFDAYWRTRIGTLAEYRGAANAAGLREVSCETLNAATAGFWELSIAWTRVTKALLPSESLECARLERSLAAHNQLEHCFRRGGIQYLRVVFERL